MIIFTLYPDLMIERLLYTFTIILITAGLHGQQTGYFTTQLNWVNVDGPQQRNLRVYVPASYNASVSYALVIGFHGLGSNPTSYTQSISYYATNANFGNVIVACPTEGTANTSWFVGLEDFDIIAAIIQKMKTSHNIDTTRVFATGFSFGGKSAYLHGLNEADLLQGIIAHSPGFYNTADIYNTCTDQLHCQHKYNYGNAWKVMACITAGSGEYNLGLTEPYLTLASKAAVKLNNSDGDAIFIEDPAGFHNLPPLSIVQQCWTHVNKPSTGMGSLNTMVAVQIYPNPASEYLHLSTGLPGVEKNISIYNMAGTYVTGTSSSEEHTTMGIAGLAEGIYLVRIVNSKGEPLFSSKFIVKR